VLTADRLLRVPKVWILPLVVSSVVVFLITLIYFGSVVDPTAHLSGLPVLIVDQDHGVNVSGQEIDFGKEITAGLTESKTVTSRLSLTTVTWPQAEERMNRGADYATVVIPTSLTTSLLALAGVQPYATSPTSQPSIVIRTNQRLGSLGTSLATGVLQPALQHASEEIGGTLTKDTASSHPSSAVQAQLTDPIRLSVSVYRPLPSHSGLGLSAFYLSLLTLMCGFLGATILNSFVDSALGYATTEMGPKWRQRRPVAISRWQTLLTKWTMAIAVIPVLTGLVLLASAGILGMNANEPVLVWLFMSLAAISVAFGTLTLFAALGTPGQLVALLIFVYLALASSGGTVPLEALSPFFRFTAGFEPLRQILDGNRALLYFDGQLDAGLGRALVVMVVELAVWVIIGVAVTLWYDAKGFSRMSPELLEYVNQSADQYLAREAPSGAT
jgi:YhgE/Pip-like protein